MNRREFLEYTAGAGAVVALGGGLWARRAYASYQLQRRLMTDIMPLLTDKACTEFKSVPPSGGDEIKRWFHGKALNVAPFVDEVCSNGYREKLHACPTAEEQHKLLLVTFCGKVVTDAEISIRVETIAEEVGRKLDVNWGACCEQISLKWKIHMKEYGKSLDLAEFMKRVDLIVKQHIAEALELARVGAQYPALGQTIGDIGRSALLVLPMTRITSSPGCCDFNPMAIPTFVFLALEHLFQYIVGLFSDPRPDLQRSISSQVSLIGNRIGAEFVSEVRTRLAALHAWQEGALTSTAQNYAESVVTWF